MNPETVTFLHDLFALCAADSAFLTLTAIHPDGDKPTPSRHVPLGNSAALEWTMARLIRANQKGWGAYFGVAPRKQNFGRWTRGGKMDLVCLPALFADLDTPDQALSNLGWFDLPASCILHSGRGYHAYWFLDAPTVDFVQADQVLRGLAQRLNGDEALSVAQSMRLPGTINTKDGRDGAVCSFISYHPERRYDFGEFRNVMPTAHQHRAWRGSEGYGQELSRTVIDKLTDAVIGQLEGHWRGNGYIAAFCPFPHLRDRPGMHFSYHAESGWSYCFGKHGKIPPSQLGRELGVLAPEYNYPLWSESQAA